MQAPDARNKAPEREAADNTAACDKGDSDASRARNVELGSPQLRRTLWKKYLVPAHEDPTLAPQTCAAPVLREDADKLAADRNTMLSKGDYIKSGD